MALRSCSYSSLLAAFGDQGFVISNLPEVVDCRLLLTPPIVSRPHFFRDGLTVTVMVWLLPEVRSIL